MSTYIMGFYGEMGKIIFQISSNAHIICSSDQKVMLFLSCVNEIMLDHNHEMFQYFAEM